MVGMPITLKASSMEIELPSGDVVWLQPPPAFSWSSEGAVRVAAIACYRELFKASFGVMTPSPFRS